MKPRQNRAAGQASKGVNTSEKAAQQDDNHPDHRSRNHPQADSQSGRPPPAFAPERWGLAAEQAFIEQTILARHPRDLPVLP